MKAKKKYWYIIFLIAPFLNGCFDPIMIERDPLAGLKAVLRKQNSTWHLTGLFMLLSIIKKIIIGHSKLFLLRMESSG